MNIYTYKRQKLDSCLLPCANNSKWTEDLQCKTGDHETTTRKNRETVELLGRGNNFLNRTQITQQIREKINKWNYTKLIKLCRAKEAVIRLMRHSAELEKMFAIYTF
jgi:hypothetical protein